MERHNYGGLVTGHHKTVKIEFGRRTSHANQQEKEYWSRSFVQNTTEFEQFSSGQTLRGTSSSRHFPDGFCSDRTGGWLTRWHRQTACDCATWRHFYPIKPISSGQTYRTMILGTNRLHIGLKKKQELCNKTQHYPGAGNGLFIFIRVICHIISRKSVRGMASSAI